MNNIDNILKNYTIYIDSSSLMEGSMEFFKISLLNILNQSKSQMKVVDFVVKDLRKKEFSDFKQYAVKALNVLDYYRKRSLVEDIVTSGIEEGKLLNVIFNNRNLDQNDICIITENRQQAQEIVTSLSNDKYVAFDKKIVAMYLSNGPEIWDIKLPKVKPKQNKPIDEPKADVETIKPVESIGGVSFDIEEEVLSKNDKLVVSLVIDNSASIQGTRATLLKEALEIFNQKLISSDIKVDLDLSIYGFDGFSYGVIKDFDQPFDINNFEVGGVQVLGKAMDKAMKELLKRDLSHKHKNIETHRPWLIVLTDGDCYGDITTVASTLKGHLKNRELTYFPFSLSSYELEETLEPLQKLKMFLKIKEDKFDDLLVFIFNTLQTRIQTPKTEAMTLDREVLSRIIAR